MPFNRRRAALVAALLFLTLLILRLLAGPTFTRSGLTADNFVLSQNQQSIQLSRKNYASEKLGAPAGAIPAGERQKYEKIATLSQTTANFDADRTRIGAAVAAHDGIVQLERSAGLERRRTLSLGIGVPPQRFDAFIETVKAIGRNMQIEVAKNDKTNEYLQLRAKRTTLEKARATLEALAASGGSIEERMKLQNRLTEIEEQIQGLGVSLGEFDTQNELCTVKLSLAERAATVDASLSLRFVDAFAWTTWWYAWAAFGLAAFLVAGWLTAGLATFIIHQIRGLKSA
jgi:hypothetical protein